MRGRKTLGLKKQILIKVVMPMLILTVLITVIAFFAFRSAMEKEVKTELKYLCDIFEYNFNEKYPGDFTKQGTDNIYIYKGETLLNDKNEMLDDIKRLCDIDVTVFYGDMRVLTTIEYESGKRISGTAVNLKVKQEVLDAKQAVFYNNVMVNGQTYFGYYKPLYNSDQTCIGMVFAGKAAASVSRSIFASVMPILLLFILCIAAAGIYTTRSSNSIVNRIYELKKSLDKVSGGKLDSVLDAQIFNHEDEISDVGRAVMGMQRALKELVELDALTKIYNRRYAENRLKEMFFKSSSQKAADSIAIGDIDFFKKVNDTYGHDAGDMVLEQTALLLKNEMASYGFVARWGGEEFLLVFDRTGYEESIGIINNILDKIRANKVCVGNDTFISVTMTFGVTKGISGEEPRYMFNRADRHLYTGKRGGRNQVVTDYENME
ncbi:MAG: diguanylate cyclase [Eubacteriales bacterium]|nr:diguanylate cyclase [Eubacteriales bacterium]